MARYLVVAVIIIPLFPPLGLALLVGVLLAMAVEANTGKGTYQQRRDAREWARTAPYWTPEHDMKENNR